MKLQKQLSRKVNNTEYSKYVLVIPPKIIKKVGWKEGKEVNVKIKGKKLIVE